MNIEDLGRRAVACKHWRWMPGMRITQNFNPLGWRLHALRGSEEWFAEDVRGTKLPTHPNEPWFYPDLSDPATIGCLLHLVREAYSDELIFTVYDSGYWFVENQHGLMAQKNTEAEALVRVLEAAP